MDGGRGIKCNNWFYPDVVDNNIAQHKNFSTEPMEFDDRSQFAPSTHPATQKVYE